MWQLRFGQKTQWYGMEKISSLIHEQKSVHGKTIIKQPQGELAKLTHPFFISKPYDIFYLFFLVTLGNHVSPNDL